jgi:hypothetical protein
LENFDVVVLKVAGVSQILKDAPVMIRVTCYGDMCMVLSMIFSVICVLCLILSILLCCYLQKLCP